MVKSNPSSQRPHRLVDFLNVTRPLNVSTIPACIANINEKFRKRESGELRAIAIAWIG